MILDGKVVVVTGSGRGIGRAIAMRLAREGASVVINDVDPQTMQRTVDEINGLGGAAIGLKADVTVRAEVKGLVESTVNRLGGLHILVNNAGISRHARITEMTGEQWDAVMKVDLKGVFNCIQAVSRHMMQQRYGKIVNIASAIGTGVSNEGMSNYASAKGGVVQLTKVAARELGPYGINVNAVAPGAIITDLTFTSRTKAEADELIAMRKKQTALGRMGEPEDVANVVLFFTSDESSYITGQLICMDGGRTDRI